MNQDQNQISYKAFLRLFTFTISTPAGYSLPKREPILENIQVFSCLYISERRLFHRKAPKYLTECAKLTVLVIGREIPFTEFLV